MDRRIADVQAEKSSALLAEYDQLVASEKARRVAWAMSLVTTAERAYDVSQNVQRRKQITEDLAALGQNVAGARTLVRVTLFTALNLANGIIIMGANFRSPQSLIQKSLANAPS